MRKIYKYWLSKITKEQELMLPINNTLLSVQNQDEEIVVWISVDESQPRASNSFCIVLTGQQEPDTKAWKYLNTLQFERGQYVVHIYQRL